MANPKIMLIAPPTISIKGAKEDVRVFYSLGLMYIASFLEQRGYKVQIIDCLVEDYKKSTSITGTPFFYVGLTEKEIARRISQGSPDIIGISCFSTFQLPAGLNVAKIVRQTDPSILTVTGGVGATLEPYQCIQNGNVDIVVEGEGEITFSEVVEAYCQNKPIEKVKGIYYRKNGEVKYTGQRELIKNIDVLPFPAYHLLPLEKYFEAGERGYSARRAKTTRWASLITSRGCPYNCCFCSANKLHRRVWRGRSPENVVDEIEYLLQRYNINHIYFEDDNMTLNLNRVEKIFDLILERNLDFSWETPNGLRADRFTPSFIEKMAKCGCNYVALGIENGNQQFLNQVIHKQLDLRVAERNATLLVQKDINVIAFFILGIPGETRKTINDTIKFAVKLARKGVVPRFFIACPHPHTEMLEVAIQQGWLTKTSLTMYDYLKSMYLRKSLMCTPNFTPEALSNWRKKAVWLSTLNILLFNPRKLWKIVRNFAKTPRDSVDIIRKELL